MKREKVAFVSLTIPMAISPEDVNLGKDCTEDEFEEAAYEYASEVAAAIHSSTGWEVNDIECDVREW